MKLDKDDIMKMEGGKYSPRYPCVNAQGLFYLARKTLRVAGSGRTAVPPLLHTMVILT